MTPISKNEKLVKLSFSQEMDSSKWKCVCGNVREKKQGWSNLLSHIYSQHNDFVSQPTFQKALQSDSNVKFRTKTIWLNTFMEHICLRVQPFSSIQDESLRRGLRLEPISINTIQNIWNY